MLDFLRNNIKRFAIVLWIAAAAFIIGGAYLFVRGPFTMGSNTAIEVGNTKISFQDYQKTYNNIYNFYVQMLTQLKGGNFSDDDLKKLNIKQKAIDILVERALLLQQAKKEGIKVSNEDVLRAIESNKAFYYNGKFSKEKYLALLKANNINPKDYEDSLKTALYIDKLKKRLFKDVKVSDKDVKSFFDKNYSKINLDFVSFDISSFKSKVKVDDEKLNKFYQKHKSDYRIPTMVKFEYIVVPLSYVKKKIKVTDNETEAFYNAHKDYFKVPLRIKVAHILISSKDNQTDSKLRKKADDVYKLLEDKKISFKEAAKKYSSDDYTRNVGGELGYVTKDMVIDEFWNNIIKLKRGEISKPFKTKFGYHIALVEDIKKPFVRPFKSVKDQIKDYLKTNKAKKVWFVEADKIFVKIRDSKESMKKAAKEFGLPFKETDYMSLKNPQTPFTAKMVQNALLSNKGALLGPDLSSAGYVIYKLTDKKPSYIPPFDKVKDKIKKDYIEKQAIKLALAQADNILKQIKASKSLKDVALAFKLKVETVKNLSKLMPTDKFPCSLKEDIMSRIFQKGKGYADKCQQGKKIYVFEVTDKIFDEKEFNKLKESIRNELISEKENEILEKFIDKLKKQTKIKINPKL
ncbi:SurA N-terminal domain-containing protein [Hippea maritima]|uniref:Periplasmic chaperone PpiD n=1 Tax=Hippea maritima (strain ATCC 700847 / DSM 10411 / MH2) TaxID=760142 RepID=F2LVG3_HIPMA|nr:SurA N-terminal domain-containing protein [Hippea maritima]AEA33747.1 PpiC-type peptidyl-prolyl cis-trans isomerase [Hippea maritima DSM 10411]